MAGMHHRGWEAGTSPLVQQIVFDCSLLNTVVTEWFARLRFSRRHQDARSMHPDGPAVQEVSDRAAQRIDKMPSALEREAYHVHDRVWAEVAYLTAERTGLLRVIPVDAMLFDRPPGLMGVIRIAAAPTDDDDVMSSLDQPGN
jgi:hypothetical protein